MNNLKNLTIYREWFRLIDTIKPTSKRDEFLGKLLDFYFKDEKPKLKPNSVEEIIWENIAKPLIAYKIKVVNGSKGGRPKKTETKTESKSKTKSKSKTNQDVDVDVNVNVNSNLYEYIENNFGRTLNPIEYEEISKWEDNDLTRYAIKLAVLNNAYSIKYIEAILNNWKTKGIKTVMDAQKQTKKNTADVPEWFDKDLVKDELNKNDENKLKELISKYE